MVINNSPKKLNKSFYTRDLITVAKELLGKIFVKEQDNQRFAGRIIEVEAYDGDTDEAAHTFSGKTKRNEIMFAEGGYLYVYFTYGTHFCSNIVTGSKGKGTAVLLRALEPIEGIEIMAVNRFGRNIAAQKDIFNLTSGPGKICKALNINKNDYGTDLTGNTIYLLNQPKIKEDNIVVCKRIGIKKSVDLPWRFYIRDNPFISKK